MAEIEYQTVGRVARLTLNNPEKHNALTRDGIELFRQHLNDIKEDREVRVLVITGAGGQTFCSGGSLEQLRQGQVSGAVFNRLAERLAALPIPKIAAMNGSAYGGGVEIGLCCDYRIGVKGMKAMVPAARFGLCYPVGGMRRYVTRLGVETAKRLLVLSETMNEAELVRVGYLHEVTEPGALGAAADRMAQHIAGLGPLAVRAMLRLCEGLATGDLDEKQALRWAERCSESSDLQEGLQAALEKRKPEFRGR